MTRKYFGTDGIRGRTNQPPITTEIALRLAKAAGAYFTRGAHKHTVVIGKDTRLSGYMLEPALTAGFASMGMNVVLTGPLPTPAIGMLARSMRADLGVMISASHNAYEDNGIKLFGPDGFKLSDEVELEIEALMESDLTDNLAKSPDLGRVKRLDDVLGRYIEFVKSSFPRSLRLDGLKVVVDCAHGAAYRVAPTVLHELGAEVVALNISPNGTNINANCGATAPQGMCEAVLAEGADMGLCLDGDADRCILADEKGQVIDGDQLLGLIGAKLQERKSLSGGKIVATVMSNLGLERALESKGLGLHRTPVGDRYVVEAMRQLGCNLGGEQSGHIVMTDFTTTGDGLIAALQVLAAVIESGQPASKVTRFFDPVPQLLRNVRYEEGDPLEEEVAKAAIASAENRLSGAGRLLIRKSGTEPVIRVMAEGDDETLVEEVVSDVCEALAAS